MHSSVEAVPGIGQALRTALLENTMSWSAGPVAMLPETLPQVLCRLSVYKTSESRLFRNFKLAH